MGRGYARRRPIYPEAVRNGHTGMKRGAAAALEVHDHTFTATSGTRVTCSVDTYQEWLGGNAKFRTELRGPEACRATQVVVGWRYTDTAGVRHRGRQIALGGRVAEAAFSNVADGGDCAGGH